MNPEKPNQPDLPEIDILNLQDSELRPQIVLMAIEQVKRLIAPWGRNGDEFSTLFQYAANIEVNPSPENMRAAVKYMKGLLSSKQDYN
ncbi:MAG: hypothetical protein MUF19_04525 [Candidatus Pacebacteria bacterium]|jgi:hypothetical protein|nr:hypothetical protein [Candidatus Paceibacterota bacterium]